MSGRIRRGLTTVLESIQAYTKNATQIMNEDVDETTAEKLGLEKANLESAIALIAELDDKWGSYIDGLDAPQKMAEESVYMSFPHKAGRFEDGKEVLLSQRHFLDQNQFAREVLNMVKETIKSLERSRTNSRQSALSESNHSVDLNDEINNARTKKLDARMNNAGIENLNARINRLEINNAGRNNAGTSGYHAPQPRVNLPLLQLPHFSGDAKEWPTFWQMFSSTIDNEPSYDNVLKMSYLLSLLDGPVLNVVAGYLPTNENYPRVVELLKSRYGDSRALKEALQSELYHLAPAHDSVIGLRKFLDVVERVCRQLSDYGIQDDSWIIFALKEKLPRGILAKLIEKEKMAGKTWKIENWRSELNLLISVEEEVQRCTVNNEPERPPRRDGRPFYQPEPTRSFPVASQYKPLCCSLCQEGGHFPSECTKYGNTQARRDRLLEQNRCLNCLRDGHRAIDCPNHRRCSKCQGHHHFLVCFLRDVRNQTQPNFGGFAHRTSFQPSRFEPVAKQRQSAQSIWERRDEPHSIDHGTRCDAKLPAPKENSVVATVMNANKPTAYLMTKRLMVTARGRKERIPVYVFFDTGSQTSFVSRRLVEKLNPPRGREIDLLEIHGFGGALSNPLKIRSPTYMVKIQRTDGNWEEISLNCTEEIATPFDMISFDEYFYNRTGVDSLEVVREKPDIMIGIKQFWKFFVSKGKEILPGLHSIRTVFGTMTAGETNFGYNSNEASMSLVAVHSSNEKHLPTPNAVEAMSSPTVGEVVLVEENFWPIGKVAEHNVCGPILQSSQIKMANGRIVTRPVSRLYPLEVKQMEEEINEREIESNENMNGTLVLELDIKKDENPSQNKPKVEKQAVKPHPMVTRAKAKLAASTLMALCLCILAGLMVFGPLGNQKMEKLSYELPTERLFTDYHWVAKFWKNSREMFSTEMKYPALNECLLLDSTFGIDLIVNPSCYPSLAVLWALVTLTMLTGLCSVLTLCRSYRKNFRMIVAIGRMGCQCWRRTKRKTAYTRARTRETIRNKTKSSIHNRFGNCCHRGQTGIQCVFNQAATLTLWHAGQSDAMMIRDDRKKQVKKRKTIGGPGMSRKATIRI
ncbi:unnamed protein product [Meloidogyne enterolobii]|uniref:Uncharacterized protein n=1 Tax=Meloidogyne enterolobii TaxID=390850 RepID=A0ACB0ZJ65_MELEN